MLSPKDNVTHVIKMSKGEWRTEIKDVARSAFRSADNLGRFGLLDMHAFPLDQQEQACAEATELALWTMSERSWSLHLTYHAPPLRYAGAMSAHAEVRNQVVSMMKAEWISVLKINSLAHTDVNARRLNDDAFWMNSKPVRLLYLVFERGNFNPLYDPFQRLLRTVLETLPDSRIIEQLHHWLRDLSRKSKSDCSSVCSRMNACQTSNVLRTRGIETVSITREEFTRAMRGGVKLCGLKRKWSSSSHNLPI